METGDRAQVDVLAERHPMLRRTRLLLGALLALGVVCSAIAGIRTLSAAASPTISVNPSNVTQLWYKPTPITITIDAANLTGPGLTPVAAWQYGLQWDPQVLRYISGPNPTVGPLTPTPTALPCTQVLYSGVTPTPTPTWFVATYTPTATNTPAAGTPSNTPTVTFTPSLTPTPSGYFLASCFTLSKTPTSAPSGTLGTFTFLPLATAPANSTLNLVDIKTLDFYASPVVPTVVAVPGAVHFAACHDVNADGVVNILDLSLVAGHFLTTLGNPGYVAAYDVNSDGAINIIDLSLVASAFLLTC